MSRVLPVAEVAAVLASFFGLRALLRDATFATWQSETFGSAPVSSTILFFILPMAFVLAGRKNPGLYGLAAHDLAYHLRVGLRAAWVLLLSGMLFPLIQALGSTHEEWLGALILTAGITAVGLLAVRLTTTLESRESRAVSTSAAGAYLGVLALGILACAALHLVSGGISPIPTRVVRLLLFVGFLEEFFFRGYLQSRLNDAFGRPWNFAGVALGPGLILAAAIFGLAHPLTSLEGSPWPWAVWTGTGGLVFGFLREKTGSALAPAIAHGLWVLPSAFFPT